MVELDIGWGRLALLPSAPYSAEGASPACVMGVVLERQRGVHAIEGEARRDFDAWPGEFALAAPGVSVFSESGHGGEYLLLEVDAAVAPPVAGAPRRLFPGQRQAMAAACSLRRVLLSGRPDAGQAAQLAAVLLAQGALLLDGATVRSAPYDADRALHARVLEAIEEGLASPLPLEELAALSGLPLLRFLRSFAHATGMTPHAWITERRLQRARRLLRHSSLPLADIAAACGFSHQSHLGVLLKRATGHTPARYRAG